MREAFKSFPAQKKNCQALDYWQFLLTHRSARERLARHNFLPLLFKIISVCIPGKQTLPYLCQEGGTGANIGAMKFTEICLPVSVPVTGYSGLKIIRGLGVVEPVYAVLTRQEYFDANAFLPG